ncbi:MAG: hypothetical protein ACHQRM_05225 [Bacteroidia bacterium]
MHKRLFQFLLLLTLAAGLHAQHMEAWISGSAGIDRAYPGIGFKYYLTNKTLIGFEFGTGQLGSQSELASAGNSPNLNGSSGWESSISSSNVIPPDGNAPVNAYPGSITTRFTGQFYRASYEWFFPSRKSNAASPAGMRAGFELAYFSIIQRQDIQYRSFNSPDVYEYNGTSHCNAIAPGIRLGYELPIGKHIRFLPELASPFYIPLGRHAKSNGPFAKETLEVRLGIGWMIK